MSSIEKLLIRGIRSFSPEEPAVIEFYSPVTLIVGHNGAGKTTIIECLKYATTGDLPPNSKGGAFIHDPKLLANESLVKAQVKLKFRNVRGSPMVVTRSIQLSVKNKKSELKTLEGLLVTTDPATGEQISISSRVADLDAEVPLHLGVSRAVLENVIFCHQEESMWPLSEPSILKKKFDDIFAATRYTKALDTLKNLKKQLLADLKVEQQKLELCKSDREKALKLNSNMEVSHNKLNDVASRIQSLESHIESCNARIQQIGEELRGVNVVHCEFDKASHELEMLQSTIRELENSGMRILSESEDQLALKLEQHSQVANRAINDQSQLISQKDSLVRELSVLSCDNTSKQVQLGTLKASLADYERRWQTFVSKFPHESVCIDSLDAIAQKFSDASDASKSTLLACEASFNELNNNFTHQLNMLTVKRATMEDSKKQLRKSADDQRNKLSSVLAQISEIENTDESIEELEARVINEEAIISKLTNDLAQANYDAQMTQLQRNKRGFEENAVNFAGAFSEASKSLDARAKLDLKREDLGKKCENLNKMLKEILTEAQNNQLTVVAEEPDHIEKFIDSEWKEKERLLRELQEKLSAGKQNRCNLEAKLAHLRDLLEKKTALRTQNESKISSAIGRDNLETSLEDAEDKLQAFYSQQSTQAGSVSTFEGFFQKLSNDPSCPLCERSFASRVDCESLVIKLKKMIEQMSQIKINGKSKTELEAKVQQLRSLRLVNDELKRLIHIEIPEVVKFIQETSEEYEKSILDVEEWSSELSSLSLYEKQLGFLKRKAEEANKLARETKNIQKQISGMESELLLLSSSGSMSLEELQIKLTENQSRIQNVQSEIESLSQEMRLRQNDLNLKQSRFRDLKEQILKTKMATSEKINLIQQQRQLKSELSRLNEETQRLESELSLLFSRHSALEEEKRVKLNEAQEELQLKKNAYMHAMSVLQNFEIEFRPFKQDPSFAVNLQNEISLVNETIGKLKESIENKTKKLQEVTNQLSAFNKQTSELEMITRQIRDNQRLHEMRRRKSTLDARVQELQAQVGKSAKNELLSHLQKAQFRHSDLMGERSGLLGEAKQLQDQLNQIELELREDYPNVEVEYRRQYIKCETAMMAAEDIEKYSRALDSAIMKYHSGKMEEINRIIRELWTGTYQGADIDTVEIRADAETTAVNRSYNYRVVMVKGGDRELDMRGRSSAGQRVLASLIIRLALAETFGLQCGVLALDEPTTNLDRENIEGLAAALAELVRVRRTQSNFQLLIITHDEEFVATLGRHQCADYYWRIDKDENQHSIIERQSIQTF